MAGHTKTPWHATLARTLIHIGNDNNGVCSISIAPPRIPERDMREMMVARAKADAEFIVEAVNSHDALKAENERLRNLVEGVKDCLDNSQSLLVMIHHLGTAFDGSGIMPHAWEDEHLTKLLVEQIDENRSSLTPPKEG